MKTWNIVLKQDNKDNFDVNVASNEKKLTIDTGQTSGRESILSTNVFTEFNKRKLAVGVNVHDLLHLALGVYTADQVVSRENNGFQGWSRHFKLFIPVSEIAKWIPCKRSIEELLSFLSGDKWEIIFRQKTTGQERLEFPTNTNSDKIQKVALFSGGLDSFIGALNLLEDKVKVAFVSHYKRGSESSVQTSLYEAIGKKYGEKSFVSHQFYVQPNQKHKDTSKEGSSRARSFLFMCLGLSVANSLGQDVDFIIPENGLISLNVPLTGTRLSSHSTRTTHPFYLKLFKDIVYKLGIKNAISNPFQFLTKGEMMTQCKNQALLKSLNSQTLSCSHSEHSRYAGLSPGIHCGYCVPCLIRQAAEKKSKITGTQYVHPVVKSPPGQTTKSGSDIRAFKLALERMEGKSDQSIMFDVLSSGPVPFDNENELKDYVGVFKRGMKEVKNFLKK
jgi:7-cyano-7-deazaguanine synthase in queuosine biosynthesis